MAGGSVTYEAAAFYLQALKSNVFPHKSSDIDTWFKTVVAAKEEVRQGELVGF